MKAGGEGWSGNRYSLGSCSQAFKRHKSKRIKHEHCHVWGYPAGCRTSPYVAGFRKLQSPLHSGAWTEAKVREKSQIRKWSHVQWLHPTQSRNHVENTNTDCPGLQLPHSLYRLWNTYLGKFLRTKSLASD